MVEARVRVGGLMRCCLATLDAAMAARTELPKEGEVLPCAHCTSSMVFNNEAWEWNRPIDLRHAHQVKEN